MTRPNAAQRRVIGTTATVERIQALINAAEAAIEAAQDAGLLDDELAELLETSQTAAEEAACELGFACINGVIVRRS